jgi:hypothetical protein
MANFKVLKDFNGSQTGARVETFTKGDTVELTDDLAQTALAEKWVKPLDKPTDKSAPAVKTPQAAAQPEG